MTSFVYVIRKFLRRDSLSNKSSASSKSKTETAADQASSVDVNSTSIRNNKSSDHRFEGGRRFHNREDVSYVLPNDDEEIDRIHQQHWVFKVAFQSNYEAPLKEKLQKGIKVLDCGCGPATWTLEMAETYPASKFYGVDISTVFPETIKPANCFFEIANIGKGLPFPDQNFDFVHQRLLQMGLTAADWNMAIKEHMRVVKQGGWVELTEFDIEAENLGPKTRKLVDAFLDVTRAKGLVPDVAPKLVGMLKKEGACNVQETIVRIPMNHNGKLGALFWEDFQGAFHALQPILVKSDPKYGNNDEFAAFLADCGEECKRNRTDMRFHRVIGQRPLTLNNPSSDDPYAFSA